MVVNPLVKAIMGNVDQLDSRQVSGTRRQPNQSVASQLDSAATLAAELEIITKDAEATMNDENDENDKSERWIRALHQKIQQHQETIRVERDTDRVKQIAELLDNQIWRTSTHRAERRSKLMEMVRAFEPKSGQKDVRPAQIVTRKRFKGLVKIQDEQR